MGFRLVLVIAALLLAPHIGDADTDVGSCVSGMDGPCPVTGCGAFQRRYCGITDDLQHCDSIGSNYITDPSCPR
jgi:hypothetical protein